MKIGQSVVILTFKQTGVVYIFGSLSAIYTVLNAELLGMSYSSLRNAVSKYMRDNDLRNNDNNIKAHLIYDTPKSTFTLQRGNMIMAEKKQIGEY